ncbi:hypothetical protein K474DRAFT_1668277 [Panus rudis PR-1116 ss-1]|nr:hypothetical protein K474DRAFT_1668277 [Panus rudis PR-1116 ss-1]
MPVIVSESTNGSPNIETSPLVISDTRRLLAALEVQEDATDAEYNPFVYSVISRALRILNTNLSTTIGEKSRCQILEFSAIWQDDADKVSMKIKTMWLKPSIVDGLVADTLKSPVTTKLQARAGWFEEHTRVDSHYDHMIGSTILFASLRLFLERCPEKDFMILSDFPIGYSRSSQAEQPIPVYETGTDYTISLRGTITYILVIHPVSPSLKESLRSGNHSRVLDILTQRQDIKCLVIYETRHRQTGLTDIFTQAAFQALALMERTGRDEARFLVTNGNWWCPGVVRSDPQGQRTCLYHTSRFFLDDPFHQQIWIRRSSREDRLTMILAVVSHWVCCVEMKLGASESHVLTGNPSR